MKTTPGFSNPDVPRASTNFYRNVFALLTFAVFACALLTTSPAAFGASLLFGALSRTAVKKNWKNPEFCGKCRFIVRGLKGED
ncbi:MAG: hypothetical protein LBT31_10485 [Synergistaceae bacterium]|nr:hypothetical protein [Synergistaceae bacterium]